MTRLKKLLYRFVLWAFALTEDTRCDKAYHARHHGPCPACVHARRLR